MRLNRVMIAAVKSGSGKTTITCALLQILKEMKINVASYKCGPDYIDPMFHQKVIGIPSKNLDTFFTDEEKTRHLLLQGRQENDFAVLEGVMGIFDGLGGVREEGSSYHLATVTQTPVILVVDAKGMGQSVIPLLAGFLAYDKAHLIKGVILNRMSKSYYEILKPLIEEQLPIEVIGYCPENTVFHIGSRHLGLLLPNELEDIEKKLQASAALLKQTISMEKVIRIAKDANELAFDKTKNVGDAQERMDGPLIAVAKDEAFCFYYEDNLRMLREAGARIQFFSPIHDSALPKGCSGLLLGGGYPEIYAKELSRNQQMLTEIKRAFDDGMPIVAECGGFLYMHEEMQLKDGSSYKMVGAIKAKCKDTGKLVRFGYIELEEKGTSFLPAGERIRGHEFHYFDSNNNGTDCLAVKPVTGKTYPCVIADGHCWMGFPHLYYPSNPAFVEAYVKQGRSFCHDERPLS